MPGGAYWVIPSLSRSLTVILRPDNDESSGFRLASIGRGPGDVGF